LNNQLNLIVRGYGNS